MCCYLGLGCVAFPTVSHSRHLLLLLHDPEQQLAPSWLRCRPQKLSGGRTRETTVIQQQSCSGSTWQAPEARPATASRQCDSHQQQRRRGSAVVSAAAGGSAAPPLLSGCLYGLTVIDARRPPAGSVEHLQCNQVWRCVTASWWWCGQGAASTSASPVSASMGACRTCVTAGYP
jgi:hypothetical protein